MPTPASSGRPRFLAFVKFNNQIFKVGIHRISDVISGHRVEPRLANAVVELIASPDVGTAVQDAPSSFYAFDGSGRVREELVTAEVLAALDNCTFGEVLRRRKISDAQARQVQTQIEARRGFFDGFDYAEVSRTAKFLPTS